MSERTYKEVMDAYHKERLPILDKQLRTLISQGGIVLTFKELHDMLAHHHAEYFALGAEAKQAEGKDTDFTDKLYDVVYVMGDLMGKLDDLITVKEE